MKAFKFKLKTKNRRDLAAKLEQTLDFCRELHHAAVQERRDADQINGLSLDLSSQKKQLPEIKELRPDLAAVHSQVLQDVLIRVDKSFNNFFTCTIKREAGDWFVIFTVETASQAPLAKTNQKVGLDVGLEKFAALSNGEMIANPRFYKTAEAEIAAAAQNLSCKRIGSHNRRKAKIKLAALTAKSPSAGNISLIAKLTN